MHFYIHQCVSSHQNNFSSELGKNPGCLKIKNGPSSKILGTNILPGFLCLLFFVILLLLIIIININSMIFISHAFLYPFVMILNRKNF